MSSQTYVSGYAYYREQHGSRSHGQCPARGGSVTCRVPDEQVDRIVAAIELAPDWLKQVLVHINLKDEVARVAKERERVKERLRRLGRTYIDGLCTEDDYGRQKRCLGADWSHWLSRRLTPRRRRDGSSCACPSSGRAQHRRNATICSPRCWTQSTLTWTKNGPSSGSSRGPLSVTSSGRPLPEKVPAWPCFQKTSPRLHRRGLIPGRAYGGDGGESDYAGNTGGCRSSMPWQSACSADPSVRVPQRGAGGVELHGKMTSPARPGGRRVGGSQSGRMRPHDPAPHGPANGATPRRRRFTPRVDQSEWQFNSS